MNLKNCLKKYFGYEEFREKQIQIVKGALKNWDQLVILPTGSGKSICYQLPALIDEGLTIIICPLCSLINDQINNLKAKNIKAFAIFSETTSKLKNEICSELLSKDNSVKMLYTTPETLDTNITLSETIQELYKLNKLKRFVIDEAHCISSWGNDFRVSYRRLTKLKDKFKNIPIMALTATATLSVRQDIVSLLKFKNYKGYTKSYYRKNLKITIVKKDTNYYQHLYQYLLSNKDSSGIIYCNSRKKCEELSEKLNNDNFNSISYHAGLSNNVRVERENSWKAEKIKIMVATIAFGMGIDKGNVRFVIHNSISSSIENYYQEIGRAGRDDNDSECILYYSYQDKVIWERLLRQNERGIKSEEYMYHQINKLNDMCCFCENLADCRHCQLSNYLGEIKDLEKDLCLHNCDNCKQRDNIVYKDVTDISNIILELILNLNNSCYKTVLKSRFLKHERYTYLKEKYKTVKNLNEIYNRIIIYLIVNKYIKEVQQKNDNNFWSEKYTLYQKANLIISGQQEIKIPVNNENIINKQVDNDQYQNTELYQMINQLRFIISKQKKIPPYCVFKNSVIIDLVKYKPNNKDMLYHINGLGDKTIKNLGDEIIEIINKFS